jgi:anti-anti-sigma regulatory factor
MGESEIPTTVQVCELASQEHGEDPPHVAEYRGTARFVLRIQQLETTNSGGIMPTIHIDKVGEMAIIECAGRFVRSEAALKLRDAVTSQTDAHEVILDLTEMHALGGGGLGMLVRLQRWAQDHDIRFKLFNPSRSVLDKLNHIDIEIATLEQMMTLLSRIDRQYAGALLESQFPSHQLSQYS